MSKLKRGRARCQQFVAFLKAEKDALRFHSHVPPTTQSMVNWFEPRQLLRTAWEAMVSATLGRHADRRSIEAANKPARFFDFSGEPNLPPFEKYPIDREEYPLSQLVPPTAQDIWIDYVSDLGDGFHSTYAVAYSLAQDELHIPGLPEPLQRGQILIFGGDEVYPTADRQEYKARLELPYIWAWKSQKKPTPPPFLFALPGNHDWYDSLSSFLEFFGDYERQSFADGYWRVPQNRSYFALKLPQQWWVLGIDFQLQSDLDYWQIKYFEKVVQYMQPGDRIILCCAEPFWVYEEMKLRQREEASNLSRLLELLEVPKQYVKEVENEERTRDKRIVVFLAGDLHHYFRIFSPYPDKEAATSPESASNLPPKGILKITAGGGGAFLHPTHGGLARAFAGQATQCYPSLWRSRCIGFLNLLFPLYNRAFCLLTGVLYAVLGGVFLLAGKTAPQNSQQGGVVKWVGSIIVTVGSNPRWLLVLAFLVAGFYFFTSPSRWHTRCRNHWEFYSGLYKHPFLRIVLGLVVILGGVFLLSQSQQLRALPDGGVLGWICRLLVITGNSPLLLFLVVLTLTGFYLITFSEPMAKGFGFGAGGMHGLCQVVAAFSLAQVFAELSYNHELEQWHSSRLASLLSLDRPIRALQSIPAIFPLLLLLGVCGLIIGPLLVGIYLAFSLNVCGQQITAAFSSLKIQGWKNFLRMKINLQTGELTIYPIGISQVPRQWEPQIKTNVKITRELVEADYGEAGYTEQATARAEEDTTLSWRTAAKNELSATPVIPDRQEAGYNLHYQPKQPSDLKRELIEGPLVLTPCADGKVLVSLRPAPPSDTAKETSQAAEETKTT